jgi:hypothetical protein
MAEAEVEADAGAVAAADEDEDTDAAGSRDVDGVQDAEGASPHPQGLVASGAQDEPN